MPADPPDTDPIDRDPRERELERRSGQPPAAPWMVVVGIALLAAIAYVVSAL